MHPQNPLMMRIDAEERQRDVERQLRLRQARAASAQERIGLIASGRRSIGHLLIGIGRWIQPASNAERAHDPGAAIELAR